MAGAGWLLSAAAELPSGTDWLSPREREVLAGLRREKRRGDWLLGRWAAKRAVAGWLHVATAGVEVIAADDGAPRAFLDGEPAPAALSLSHRHGRALAAVAGEDVAVGCDLEPVEPRSPAFVREWLAPAERDLVAAAGREREAVVANLVWCGKEATAKARRGGLRLNVRRAVVSLGSEGGGDWRPLEVRWEDEGAAVRGWWREEPGWVMAVVTEPAGPAPAALPD